jgi:hypothetical protein
MKLVPLKQWICDTCGEVIDGAENGFLEWITGDDRKAHDFHIVHHYPVSPRRDKEEGCYQHEHAQGRRDSHLNNFTDQNGLTTLLAFVDVGHLDSDDGGPWVRSAHEFAEIVRRLWVRHYEEARLYWSAAAADGVFDGANEISPYTQRTLKEIVNEYGDAEEAEEEE